jgi:hypothetical protein
LRSEIVIKQTITNQQTHVLQVMVSVDHVVVADDQAVRNVDEHDTPPSVAVATHVCHVAKAVSRLVVNVVDAVVVHAANVALKVGSS